MDDYIKYSSTRGGDDSLSYEEVLLAGLATVSYTHLRAHETR